MKSSTALWIALLVLAVMIDFAPGVSITGQTRLPTYSIKTDVRGEIVLAKLCPTCGGTGEIQRNGRAVSNCPDCRGLGYLPTRDGRILMKFIKAFEIAGIPIESIDSVTSATTVVSPLPLKIDLN